MPESVSCPSCRSGVAIPADHAEPTIRCGICWAEVAVSHHPVPTPSPSTTVQNEPTLAIAKRPVAVIPGKALPGMAKLEERMQRAAARLAPPPRPAKPVVAAAAVVKSAPPLVEIQPQAAPAVVPLRVHPQPAYDEPVVEVVDDEPDERPSRPPRSRASSRRFHRDDDGDDGDEYDDRSRRRTKPSTGKSALPLVLGVGAFVLILVGGAYLIARLARDPSDRDPVPVAEGGDGEMQFNLPNPDANPAPAQGKGFNPFPQLPNMQPPGANLALVAHTGDGYTAKIFARPMEHPSFLNLYDNTFLIAHAQSKRLRSTSQPPSVTIEITTADVPQGVTADLKKIVTETVFRKGEVKAAKIAGHDGFEHNDDFAGRVSSTAIVQVGCRIFMMKFTILDAFGNRPAAEAARKEFFDSFKITFDPNTPAPVDPALVPRRLPNRPPNFPQPPRPKLPGQP